MTHGFSSSIYILRQIRIKYACAEKVAKVKESGNKVQSFGTSDKVAAEKVDKKDRADVVQRKKGLRKPGDSKEATKVYI